MKAAILAAIFVSTLGSANEVLLFPTFPVAMTQEMFIIQTSLEFGIDPSFPLAVANHESRMQAYAIGTNKNGTHDWGLFQLNDSVVKKLHVSNPLDYKQNTIAGVGLIAMYLHDYGGDQHRAWCAYAKGPGACR